MNQYQVIFFRDQNVSRASMKALAASSIGQYERSVLALADYVRTVELGLGVCFRENTPVAAVVVPLTLKSARSARL